MAWQFLSDVDRQEITGTIADLEMIRGGHTSRTVMLNEAGLAHLISGLGALANSAALTFSGELVTALENETTLPEYPTRQAMGAYLNYILLYLEDTPQAARRLCAAVISRYRLIDEDDLLTRLANEYGPPGTVTPWREMRRQVRIDTGGDGARHYIPPSPPAPGELPDPGPLPPGHRLPFGRNALFTGREDELRELAGLLLPYDRELTGFERTPVTPPARSVGAPALIASGIGGVGKTQLAVEFAHRYGRFFHGVHWVSMDNPATVVAEIALCGTAMELPGFDDLPVAEQAQKTLASWSSTEPRLVIFDNCEEPRLMASWRPRSGGARLLVTSRNTVWPPEYGATWLDVQPLPGEESRALLREYLDPDGRVETDATLDKVAHELGGLLLALALAGHYLARYRSVTVEEYLDQARRADDLLPVGRGALSLTEHELSVRRTFAASFDRLDGETEIDAVALALLARAACLAPGEPLPEWLLRAAMGDVGAIAVEDGLLRLLELGLLERSGGRDAAARGGNVPAERLYRLHRLIARFAVGALAEGMDKARAAVESTIQSLMRDANNKGDPRYVRGTEIHLRHVVDAASLREDEAAAALCNSLGNYLDMSGDLSGALRYSRKALEIRERVLGPEHSDTALSLNNLGELLRAMGESAEARPYYEQALAISERVLGPEHPQTASVVNNLGMLLWDIGSLAEARRYHEQALAIRERVLGSEHPDTALSLNNMGGLLQAMGELAEARPYYERALTISERVLGPEHPNTALSLNNLGGLLRAVGEPAEARPYYEQALAIRERVLGLEHPKTAQSLNDLGSLLQAMGEPAEAQRYYEQALAILESKLGPEHPSARIVRRNLAAVS